MSAKENLRVCFPRSSLNPACAPRQDQPKHFCSEGLASPTLEVFGKQGRQCIWVLNNTQAQNSFQSLFLPFKSLLGYISCPRSVLAPPSRLCPFLCPKSWFRAQKPICKEGKIGIIRNLLKNVALVLCVASFWLRKHLMSSWIYF